MLNEKPTPPTQEAVEAAIAAIEKAHGKGSIFRMAEDRRAAKLPAVPTGLFDLDFYVLGIGGLPKGRIVEVFGPEASCKTTLALHVVAEAQKLGGVAAFIDVEHALDPVWAELNGVDMGKLYVAQPDWGEQALQIAEELILSNSFAVIVVDSVAALVPKAELDGDIGDSHMGLQARLMSQTMRKFTGIVSKSNTVLIFINQLRDKIGVMFGSPETTTGGKALKFYASVRLDMRKSTPIKKGEDVVGNKVKIKAVKNKVGTPFRSCEVDLLYDCGLDANGSLFDAAVVRSVVEKSGAWYAYKGERLGQGRTNSMAAVTERGLWEAVLIDTMMKELN